MASKLDSDDDDIISEINITPLVDVTLVLLIIFMVTATYIVAPSIPVNLPKAASGEETKTHSISIVLDKDGQLYLNGVLSDEGHVASAVAKAVAEDPQVSAIIAADRDRSHGDVIELIDLIKLNGITRFAINIDPGVGRKTKDGVLLPPSSNGVSAQE